MGKKDKASTALPVNKFAKCPEALLGASDLSYAARIIWIAIEFHRWGDKKTCWPSCSRLAKLTGSSARYVKKLVIELESNGFLLIERRPGRAPIYTPVVPSNIKNPDTIISELTNPETTKPPRHSVTGKCAKPRKHNAVVDTDIDVNQTQNQDTMVHQLSSKPRHYSSPVDVDFDVNQTQNQDTIVHPHPDTIVHPNHTNRNRLNIREEEEVHAAAPNTKRKRQKRSPKVEGHIPTDPVEIRQILDKIDLVKYRKEWEHKIDFEKVWTKFQRTMLEGTPQNPTPNPRPYAAKGFSLGLRNWCEFEEDLNKPQQQPKPSDERDLTNYVCK